MSDLLSCQNQAKATGSVLECSGSEFVGEIPLCNVLFLNVVSNPTSLPLSFSDKMSVKMILRFKRQETFSELRGFSVRIHVRSNQPNTNITLFISSLTTLFKADLGGNVCNSTQRSGIQFLKQSKMIIYYNLSLNWCPSCI